MWNSFDLAIAGVLALGVVGFIVAWQAGKAARSAAAPQADQLQQSLDRLRQEIRNAQELARSVR